MTTDTHKTGGMGKDVVIYVCLLALAGLQFLIAYQNIDAAQMMWRMLAVAIVEGGLAMMFFMHLGSERRGFSVFVLIFTISVLLGLQYGWPDSTRMVVGAPYSSTK
jgi:heme/copper-type cytochrome/quinol oxidase subunit 4